MFYWLAEPRACQTCELKVFLNDAQMEKLTSLHLVCQSEFLKDLVLADCLEATMVSMIKENILKSMAMRYHME